MSGWSEFTKTFEKGYGKRSELLAFVVGGFNSDKSFALLQWLLRDQQRFRVLLGDHQEFECGLAWTARALLPASLTPRPLS